MAQNRHQDSAFAAALRKVKGTLGLILDNHGKPLWLRCLKCGEQYRVDGNPRSAERETNRIFKYREKHKDCR
jgi:hypothetical protein